MTQSQLKKLIVFVSSLPEGTHDFKNGWLTKCDAFTHVYYKDLKGFYVWNDTKAIDGFSLELMAEFKNLVSDIQAAKDA